MSNLSITLCGSRFEEERLQLKLRICLFLDVGVYFSSFCYLLKKRPTKNEGMMPNQVTITKLETQYPPVCRQNKIGRKFMVIFLKHFHTIAFQAFSIPYQDSKPTFCHLAKGQPGPCLSISSMYHGGCPFKERIECWLAGQLNELNDTL